MTFTVLTYNNFVGIVTDAYLIKNINMYDIIKVKITVKNSVSPFIVIAKNMFINSFYFLKDVIFFIK
jgi:hypothetical protein